MSEWKKTLCNLCAMTCGLEMEVEDNRIINVRPDPDSPSSECYCCRKGRSAKYFVENRDRLLYPKKRVGDHYERISWDQAYKEIAEKANAIRKAHGPRSAALIGGGGGATGAAAAVAQPFLQAIGSQYFFNPIGVEFMGIFWSCGRIFGDQFHPLEPDDKNCEVLIFWGSNSYVSHQLPNARPMIREFSRDPDKMVIVVDPRLSETARMADMHIAPALGSDSLFIRALIAIILEKGWQHQDFLDRYTRDWPQAEKWFRNVDIDGSLRVCGVSRTQAEQFAHILTHKMWGCHQDLGLYFGRQSTLSSYLCLVLMAVCGTLIVPGGNVPPVRIVQLAPSDEYDSKVWRMPVTNRFPVAGMYPEGAFPDEVLGDNEDRIRMAFCNMSNPARSYPDSQKMEEALSKLELFVAMDCVETETTRLADYVLPMPSAYEVGGDFDVFVFHYPEIMYFCRKGVVKAPGEAREDAMIYAELAEAMGLIPKLPQSLYDAAEEAVRTGDRMKYFLKVVMWIAKGGMKYLDQAAIIIALTLGKAMGSAGRAMNWAALLISNLQDRAILAVEPDKKQHPILSRIPKLKDLYALDAAFELVDQHPEGAIIAYSDTEHLMQRHIRHKDKKFHLWCKEIDAAMQDLTPEHEAEVLRLKDGCNMILSAGRHSDGGMNTSMRNPGTYQFRQPYALAMHPEDAAAFGFEEGETVRVTTKKGSITIPVEITWQTSRGYCLIPHHLGLQYGDEAYGMHINYLTDHQDLDELTGNAKWRYTPCRVEKLLEV